MNSRLTYSYEWVKVHPMGLTFRSPRRGLAALIAVFSLTITTSFAVAQDADEAAAQRAVTPVDIPPRNEEVAPEEGAPSGDAAAAGSAEKAEATGEAAVAPFTDTAPSEGDGAGDGKGPTQPGDAPSETSESGESCQRYINGRPDSDPVLSVEPGLPGGTAWMPVNASAISDASDDLFYGVLGMSIFLFLAITAAVIYFVLKYRIRPGKHEKPLPSSSHNDAMEVTWTVIPSIICVFLFLWGWRAYIDMTTPPRHATEINVYATQWAWLFNHEGGIADDVLHVPVNEPVRLVMTSQKVLHSFFVPAFRVKQDLVPRRFTQVWFRATKPGVYRLYCTEYCGMDHSCMKTWVKVHEPGGYEQYLQKMKARAADMDPVALGKQIYAQRGCIACHSLDGAPRVGPSFKGIWGEEHVMASGEKVTVDENYITESVVDPQAKIRATFPPSMPSFAGQLSDAELNGIIEFIKSLKE